MKYLFIITMFFLTGCLGLGNSKTVDQSETVKTGFDTQADIVEPAPLINGNNNNVHLPAGYDTTTKRTVNTKSNTDIKSEYSYAMQVSVGFNIFMFGVGAWLIFLLCKKSKVIRLTSGILDNIGASAISMATTSTNLKDIAHANHARAEIESARRHL